MLVMNSFWETTLNLATMILVLQPVQSFFFGPFELTLLDMHQKLASAGIVVKRLTIRYWTNADSFLFAENLGYSNAVISLKSSFWTWTVRGFIDYWDCWRILELFHHDLYLSVVFRSVYLHKTLCLPFIKVFSFLPLPPGRAAEISCRREGCERETCC